MVLTLVGPDPSIYPSMRTSDNSHRNSKRGVLTQSGRNLLPTCTLLTMQVTLISPHIHSSLVHTGANRYIVISFKAFNARFIIHPDARDLMTPSLCKRGL